MQKYINDKQVSEQELWEGIIEDDKNALGIVFDIYAKELITYGYRISGNIDITEDAVQDIFVDIWQYRKNLSRKVQIKYYLYSCLRRAIIRQMPKRGIVNTDITEFDNFKNSQDSIEVEWVSSETEQHQKDSISHSLSLLSDREREIISLKYYSNMKIREIALMLTLKEQTIANTLQNALKKMRKNLVYLFLVFQIVLEKIT